MIRRNLSSINETACRQKLVGGRIRKENHISDNKNLNPSSE